MKRKLGLLIALTGLLLSEAVGVPAVPTNSVSAGPCILIDPSSSSAPGFGRATLTLGALNREGENFSGHYQVKISPYAFKNEKGKLLISVSDASLQEIIKGRKVSVTGTATNGENGKTRAITAMVTPIDSKHGSVKISFFAGKKKMVFDSFYRLT